MNGFLFMRKLYGLSMYNLADLKEVEQQLDCILVTMVILMQWKHILKQW
jgi:hypothetical protein